VEPVVELEELEELLLELEEEELVEPVVELEELELDDDVVPPPLNMVMRALLRVEPALKNAVSACKGKPGVTVLVENKNPFL
jgi:hypothetical protein